MSFILVIQAYKNLDRSEAEKVSRHLGHTPATASKYYRHVKRVDDAFEAFALIQEADARAKSKTVRYTQGLNNINYDSFIRVHYLSYNDSKEKCM